MKRAIQAANMPPHHVPTAALLQGCGGQHFSVGMVIFGRNTCVPRAGQNDLKMGLWTPMQFMGVYERTTGKRWEWTIETLVLGCIWRLVVLWWTGMDLAARTSTAFSPPP